MANANTLKLFWEVKRSRGGTGDHWLHLRAERGGQYAGIASCSLSPPGEESKRGICMSALHMVDDFIKDKADLQAITHTLQYRIDSCKHWWVMCDDTKALFCGHCDSLKADAERDQPLNTLKQA